MDKKKLDRLRRELGSLREKIHSIRERRLVCLAKKLGRYRSKRGKHPTYVSEPFPEARPITIPSHAGGTLKRGTKENILDDLEGDIHRWQERLDAQQSESPGESDA